VPRQIAIGKNNRINPFPPGGRTNVFDKTYPCFVIGSGDDSAKFTLVEITFDGNHRLYQTATDIPSFQGAKDRGTASTPLPPQAGDILLEVAGTGYITTATDQEQGVYYKSGAIRFVAHETFNTGPGGGGSEIAFLTTKDGATNTSLTERLRITNEGNVGLGTPTPDASSLLDITSTAAGILIPRVTTGQRDAIASPATGLLVFNTTTVTFQFWDGVAWVDVGAGVVSSSIPPFASSCNLTPGVTKYFGLSGFAATPNASPDSNATAVMPRAGTLRNMYIRCGLGVAPSMGESITVTIFKNGVSAASITATISDTATTANDLVNTVAVSAGDYIDVQFVTTGGVATAYLQMGIELV
jgi:hypothetical protein